MPFCNFWVGLVGPLFKISFSPTRKVFKILGGWVSEIKPPPQRPGLIRGRPLALILFGEHGMCCCSRVLLLAAFVRGALPAVPPSQTVIRSFGDSFAQLCGLTRAAVPRGRTQRTPRPSADQAAAIGGRQGAIQVERCCCAIMPPTGTPRGAGQPEIDAGRVHSEPSAPTTQPPPPKKKETHALHRGERGRACPL